jgi:hypothetical protein
VGLGGVRWGLMGLDGGLVGLGDAKDEQLERPIFWQFDSGRDKIQN